MEIYLERKNIMLKLVAPTKIYADKIEAYHAAVKELVQKSNEEEGCIFYTVNQDINDPTIHYFLECWKDQEALDAHMKTEHFTKIVPTLREFVEAQVPGGCRMTEVEF